MSVEVRVTIESIAPSEGLFNSIAWVGFHDGSFDLFDLNEPASEAIERLAEDAITEPNGFTEQTISTAFTESGAGLAQATILGESGPFQDFASGDRASATFTLDESLESSQYFSYASMILPSNDAFIANDDPLAIEIFNDDGEFIGADFTVTTDRVWDAGTELNDEVPENTAALGQTEPNTGVQEGVVNPHPGFQDGGNILAAFPNADFTSPDYEVARIQVEQTEDGMVQVTIENLAPQDGLTVSSMWVGFHDGSFDLFNFDETASEALERLAEDAIIEPTGTFEETLSTVFAESGAGLNAGTIPGPTGDFNDFFPEDSGSITFTLDPNLSSSRYFSYAAMALPSNDAFIGNEDPLTFEIFNEDGEFLGADFVVTGAQVWDAGTELNDEVPENTGLLAQEVPNTGLDEGVVNFHPGFFPDGNIVAAFPNADLSTPGVGVARIRIEQIAATADPFDVVVTSAGNNGNSTALRFDGESGEFLGEFATGETVVDPRDIVPVPLNGQNVTINNGDDRVLVFDAQTGTFVEEFTTFEGLNAGGAVFGPDGNYYVGARSFGSILEFEGNTGEFLGEFVEAGQVDFPRGFDFGLDGEFFYLGNGADPASGGGGGTLIQFDGITGEVLDTDFVSDPELSPLDVVVGPDGSIFVSSEFPFGAEDSVGTVRRYDAQTGELLQVFDAGLDETGDPLLSQPRGIGFGPDGLLYVSSTGTDTVVRFELDTAEFVDVFAEFPNLEGQALTFVPSADPLPPEPIFGNLEDNVLELDLLLEDAEAFVFAGAGEDLVDSNGAGGNRLYGGDGDDELVAGTGDRLFAGSGNDILEASVGGGNNRLYGGDGDDIFFLNQGDRLLGGAGDDTFVVTSGGQNLITGGAGADTFSIANAEIPDGSNTITDFELGSDTIAIGGLGLNFESLTLSQSDGDTIISIQNQAVASLSGITASFLDESSFAFE